MGEVTVHPGQVRAWGQAARHCGREVTSAKRHVSAADGDVEHVNASGLGSVRATAALCSHWESQLGCLSTDVTGTGDKLVSTADLVSHYDLLGADPFARIPFGTSPGPIP